MEVVAKGVPVPSEEGWFVIEHLGLDGCREDAHCLDVFWGSNGIEEHEAFSAIGLWLLEESLDTKEGGEFLGEVEDRRYHGRVSRWEWEVI